MSESEVALVVRYQAMAGCGDTVAALLARHAAATRAEPGNLDFVALRSTEDPDDVLGENGGLLPGPHAKLAGPTFAEWLNAAA